MTSIGSGKQVLSSLFVDLIVLVILILGLALGAQHPNFKPLASAIIVLIMSGDTLIVSLRQGAVSAKHKLELAVSASIFTSVSLSIFLLMIGQQMSSDVITLVTIPMIILLIFLRLFPRR